ncbi:hypothetical protein V8E53_007434 [Lactarius tabidus]
MDGIYLRRRMAELIQDHKTIFAIVDKSPSWLDVDDSFGSVSDCDDKDTTRSRAGERAVIGNRLSSHVASESRQSGVSTEDDPVGPVTPTSVLPWLAVALSHEKQL